MRAAAETTDLAARAELLAEAEKIYLAEVPSIPILFYSSRALVSDKVAGYEDNILDDHSSRWLTADASRRPRQAAAARPGSADRIGGGCDADLHAAAAGERHPDGLHHHHADLLHDPHWRRAGRSTWSGRSIR